LNTIQNIKITNIGEDSKEKVKVKEELEKYEIVVKERERFYGINFNNS
jgi:hypothetical protein